MLEAICEFYREQKLKTEEELCCWADRPEPNLNKGSRTWNIEGKDHYSLFDNCMLMVVLTELKLS